MPTLPMYPILLIVSSTSSRTIRFARLETSVMLAHVVGENSSVNSGCNFRRTGGFCAVADNTADVSNGVDDRQTDIFISSARKIGNGGTGSTACADGAAVSGKTSNIFFLMNRNQVADNECAVQFFLGNVPFFCKLNDRKETVMPWFPLPELMTTGREQPLIRASEPAAARARARIFTSLPYSFSSVRPTCAPYG